MARVPYHPTVFRFCLTALVLLAAGCGSRDREASLRDSESYAKKQAQAQPKPLKAPPQKVKVVQRLEKAVVPADLPKTGDAAHDLKVLCDWEVMDFAQHVELGKTLAEAISHFVDRGYSENILFCYLRSEDKSWVPDAPNVRFCPSAEAQGLVMSSVHKGLTHLLLFIQADEQGEITGIYFRTLRSYDLPPEGAPDDKRNPKAKRFLAWRNALTTCSQEPIPVATSQPAPQSPPSSSPFSGPFSVPPTAETPEGSHGPTSPSS
jgi:hypothetical protein